MITHPKLTIRSISATPVNVPMKRKLGTSAQRIENAPLLLVDLQTEEGVSGHSYAFCYLPSVARSLVPVVADLSGALSGLALSPLDVAARMARYFKLPGLSGPLTMAASAVDGAVWDALATAEACRWRPISGGRPIRSGPTTAMASASCRRKPRPTRLKNFCSAVFAA